MAIGVNCYMKKYGVTKEALIEELRKVERENYKIMMEDFMRSKAVPKDEKPSCFFVPPSISTLKPCKSWKQNFLNVILILHFTTSIFFSFNIL